MRRVVMAMAVIGVLATVASLATLAALSRSGRVTPSETEVTASQSQGLLYKEDCDMHPDDIWPAVVAWRRGPDSEYSFLCSGSLISDRVLITELGCIRRLLEYGDWVDGLKVRVDVARTEAVHVAVEEVVVWQQAVQLLLEQRLPQRGRTVNTCLPNLQETFRGASCWLVGYGADGQSVCQTERLSKPIDGVSSFMCTELVDIPTNCSVSAGSPLVCQATVTRGYVLAGFSLGPAHGEVNLRVDFSRVDWIQQHLARWNETAHIAIGNRRKEEEEEEQSDRSVDHRGPGRGLDYDGDPEVD